MISHTLVRVVTLPERYFTQFTSNLCQSSADNSAIDGLDEAMERAQAHVDQFGIPICDFKVYKRSAMEQRVKVRFQNAVKRAIVLQKMNERCGLAITNLMHEMKMMYLDEQQIAAKKSKMEKHQEAIRKNMLNRIRTRTQSVKILSNLKENLWKNFNQTNGSAQ